MTPYIQSQFINYPCLYFAVWKYISECSHCGNDEYWNYHLLSLSYFKRTSSASILLYSRSLASIVIFGSSRQLIYELSLFLKFVTSAVSFLSRRTRSWQKQLKSSASFAFLKQIVARPLFMPFGLICISINSTVPKSFPNFLNYASLISKSRFLTFTACLVFLFQFRSLLAIVLSQKGFMMTRWASSLVTIKSSLYFSMQCRISSSVANFKRTFPVAFPSLFRTNCSCVMARFDGSSCEYMNSQVQSTGKQCPYAINLPTGLMELLPVPTTCEQKRKSDTTLPIIIIIDKKLDSQWERCI